MFDLFDFSSCLSVHSFGFSFFFLRRGAAFQRASKRSFSDAMLWGN